MTVSRSERREGGEVTARFKLPLADGEVGLVLGSPPPYLTSILSGKTQ
jgi:hypothetical protein